MLKSIINILQGVLNQLFIPKSLLLCFLLTILVGCSSTRISKNQKNINSILKSTFYDNQFTGVLILDPQNRDTLIALNDDKYFTPASNVKIFTLYTGLKLLPDKIPTLKYVKQNDTLYFEGTGDPTWLHPYFKDNTALQFLKGFKNLAFSTNNFQDTKFGPGWAWEDYEFYYSPERGSIPLYGNVVNLFEKDSLVVSPGYFKPSIDRKEYPYLRSITKNEFFIQEGLMDTLEIPFKTSVKITKELLQNQLTTKIEHTTRFPESEKKILYGISTDSIYKRMLFESDNFLAEQLMLAAASTLSDTLSFKNSRDYTLQNYLTVLEQEPRWVDGSGLSRYNLFTPTSFVHILTLLKEEIPEKRLFHLFPTWNASGTITNPLQSDEIQFIYAKSGGMGNVYNLSGYLKTKSGKVLIFSFMNNHFRKPSSQIRQNIYDILKSIHESY